ncbi:mCG145249, partial [Mus musculus]
SEPDKGNERWTSRKDEGRGCREGNRVRTDILRVGVDDNLSLKGPVSLQGSRRSWAQRSLADGLQNKKRSVALVKNSVGKRRTRKNRVVPSNSGSPCFHYGEHGSHWAG